ncbi:isoprenyl transferase [Apilactobacillus micheneri]|uniref:isoprenyl transferase n=1 Tax=Apilactobacillus micheneri TaxID=1899430 RepID=UPI000D51404A|nr:isoprenyl transferase [Apilactobacillus micheneri]GAY79260.1 ditrans,polycis-undecaprenyl-diphosphate synthase [Apilactobacillus micheneri]
MFNKNNSLEDHQLDPNNIPAHIAIIMDGNGRWAKQRHLPRIAGHKQGMEVVRTITKSASNLGIKVLTLYAFSTENWHRPEKEVKYLLGLPERFFNKFVPELIENNVKVNVMGEIDKLPNSTKNAVQKAIYDTKDCNGMILNFALNYGSHDEIVSAIKKISSRVKNGNLNVDDINDNVVEESLMTSNLKDLSNPDLLIRTSGEERLSNFLLWQVAYSEFVFDKTKWPDYKDSNLKECIHEYQNRHRRFGGLKNK